MTKLILLLLLLSIGCRPVEQSNGQPQEDYWTSIKRMNKEKIDLCIARGGVPITDYQGIQLERCDFPPVLRGYEGQGTTP